MITKIRRDTGILLLVTFAVFSVSGCDSRRETAVEKDCHGDASYERCIADIEYYVENYSPLNFWLDDKGFFRDELRRRYELYSNNVGRWVGNTAKISQAESNDKLFVPNTGGTYIFTPLLVEEAVRETLLNRYFAVNGVIYSTEPADPTDEAKRLSFLVTDAKINLLGVERFEFGISDLEALEFCDVDAFEYFLKTDYSQFACSGDFIFSFNVDKFEMLEITLEAYRLKGIELNELKEIGKILAISQATKRFKKHQNERASK